MSDPIPAVVPPKPAAKEKPISDIDLLKKVSKWVIGASFVYGLLIGLAQWVFGGADLMSKVGDSFGVVGALFSGLSLAGVAVAIRGQQKQLKLQRKELKLQRRELVLQRREQKANTKAQEAQHKAMVDSMRISMITELIKGVETKMADAKLAGKPGKPINGVPAHNHYQLTLFLLRLDLAGMTPTDLHSYEHVKGAFFPFTDKELADIAAEKEKKKEKQ